MNRDLTAGPPLKSVLKFCGPLLIGNLFQQLYSMADSIIVGKYLGVEAFAAIGATGSLNALVIGFAVGLTSGLSIPIAQRYGAGDIQGLRKAEANGLYIAAIAGVLISVLMGLFTRPILGWLNTPASILDNACAYIGTLFASSIGIVLFNVVIGFMRALGDSKTPLFLLALASVFNIVLDLLFVLVFQMGVAGAALATAVGQSLAALMGVRAIRKHFPALHLSREDMRPSLPAMGKLSAIALPIGLQCSITAIGSIFMQVAINGLGAQAVASLAVGGRVQGLVYPPMEAIGIAAVIFVCQNYGAKRLDRVRKGVSQMMLLAAAHAAVGLLITWFAGRELAQGLLGVGDADVLALMQTFLRVTGFFFVPLNMIYVYRNALQGLGFSKPAMGSGVCETLARIGVALLLVSPLGFVGVCFSSPFAWTAAGLYSFLMYVYAIRKLEKRRRAEMEATPLDGECLAGAGISATISLLERETEHDLVEP